MIPVDFQQKNQDVRCTRRCAHWRALLLSSHSPKCSASTTNSSSSKPAATYGTMRTLPLLLALLLSSFSSEVSSTSSSSANLPLKLNGWFPCDRSKAPNVVVKLPSAPAKVGAPFECAEVDVPLCHEGVCASAKTINVFVKRVATGATGTKRPAMWMLQGGPGLSSHASTLAATVVSVHDG